MEKKQLISNKDLVKVVEEQSELKADFYVYTIEHNDAETVVIQLFNAHDTRNALGELTISIDQDDFDYAAYNMNSFDDCTYFDANNIEELVKIDRLAKSLLAFLRALALAKD